jgi:hypothetical protein
MPSDNMHNHHPAGGAPGRSMPELFGDVVSELSSLFRKEVQLARAEMGEKLGSLTGAITPIVAGGVVMLAALIVLMFSVVSLLVYLGVPVGWSQLIVGLGFVLIGYLVLNSGLSRLKATSLVPARTTEQLSRDARVVKEQVQ